MMNKFKNKKGITLVALVVTVIILLILAGISIATLTGSGLFENARLAEQKSKNAQELEDATLKDYENKIGEYINNDRNNQNTNNFVEVTATFSGETATFQYPEGYNKENTYIISAKTFRPETGAWYERNFHANTTTNAENISMDATGIKWFSRINGVTFTEAKLLITKIDV